MNIIADREAHETPSSRGFARGRSRNKQTLSMNVVGVTRRAPPRGGHDSHWGQVTRSTRWSGEEGGCQALPSRCCSSRMVVGRGGNCPAITAAAKASPGGEGGGGDGLFCAACWGCSNGWWFWREGPPLETTSDVGACVDASPTATAVEIGDGAILATMIQSDA